MGVLVPDRIGTQMQGQLSSLVVAIDLGLSGQERL